MRPRLKLRTLALLLAALASGSGAAAWEPAAACAFMAGQKLPARGGYRPVDAQTHRCASARRPILAGDEVQHEIRYAASGSAAAVLELTLELQLRDRREVQRAYRLLLDYTAHLLQAALQREVPAPVQAAILGGTTGVWPLDQGDIRVEKAQVRAGSHQVLVRIRQP